MVKTPLTPQPDNISVLYLNNETTPLEVLGPQPKAKTRAKAKAKIEAEPVLEHLDEVAKMKNPEAIH